MYRAGQREQLGTRTVWSAWRAVRARWESFVSEREEDEVQKGMTKSSTRMILIMISRLL
jgi:hypothetical protein